MNNAYFQLKATEPLVRVTLCNIAAPDAPERTELDSDAELTVPQGLAVTALRNLLENALRHSASENCVRPEIRRGPVTVRFSVCDQGPGLSNKALVLARQRFWRLVRAAATPVGLVGSPIELTEKTIMK